MRDPSDARLRSVRTIPRHLPRTALRAVRRSLDRGVTWSDGVLMDASAGTGRIARARMGLARVGGQALDLARMGRQLPVWTLEGPRLRIRFAGPRAGAEYLAQSLGLVASDVRDATPVSTRGLVRQVAGWLPSDADVAVVQVPASFPFTAAQPFTFESPTWVDMVAEVPADPDRVLADRGKSTRQRLRALARKGMTTVVTQDEARLQMFYEEMYRPWVIRRFGSMARLSTLDQCRWWFDRGGLMEVRAAESGATLAAKLVAFLGTTCLCGEVGVSGAAVGDVQRSFVLEFMDWATFVAASERGCRTVNFGGTRGCTNDGVFTYKARWGARAQRASRTTQKLVVVAREGSPDACRWIDDMGFLTLQRGRLLRVTTGDTERLSASEGVASRAVPDVYRVGTYRSADATEAGQSRSRASSPRLRRSKRPSGSV